MKDARVCFVLYVLALTTTLMFAVGCGSVSGAMPQPSPTPNPSPSPAPSPSPTPAVTGSFVFGVSEFQATFFARSVLDSVTGKVTPLNPPFTDSGFGQVFFLQLLAHPNGRFLYALSIGEKGGFPNVPGIAEMEIDRATGALSRIPGGPVIFNGFARAGQIVLDPAGRFLYQPNNRGTFDIYRVNQTTGALTLAGTSPERSVGLFTTISPDGHFLLNAGTDQIETFAIDPNGNLSVAQVPMAIGATTVGLSGQVAVSPDNQFVYVVAQGSIAIFHLEATGALVPVTGSPFATDPNGNTLSLAPDGRHLYAAFQAEPPTGATSVVKGFIYDPAANTLTGIPGAQIPGAFTVNVDPSGKFAFICDSSQHFSTYAIDQVTGALTLVSQASEPLTATSTDIVVIH